MGEKDERIERRGIAVEIGRRLDENQSKERRGRT